MVCLFVCLFICLFLFQLFVCLFGHLFFNWFILCLLFCAYVCFYFVYYLLFVFVSCLQFSFLLMIHFCLSFVFYLVYFVLMFVFACLYFGVSLFLRFCSNKPPSVCDHIRSCLFVLCLFLFVIRLVRFKITLYCKEAKFCILLVVDLFRRLLVLLFYLRVSNIQLVFLVHHNKHPSLFYFYICF